MVAQEALSRPPGKDVAVTLDNGMTGEGLAELLEEKGLVRDAKVFYVQLLFQKESTAQKRQLSSQYVSDTGRNAESAFQTGRDRKANKERKKQ